MALWWIGNLILLLVVVPVVVVLLSRVLGAVRQIERTATGLRGRSASIVSLLGAVDYLPETRKLVGETNRGLERYGAALEKIL